MKSQSISIALCTCNGAKFIEEQLESIFQQTSPATELVVCDDASDDDTVARVRAAWARAQSLRPGANPALRLQVHEQRLGVARNFESALALCSGDLVVLCDQDDRWHPGRLAHLIQRMQKQPTTLLIHGDAQMIDERGQALGWALFQALRVTSEEIDDIKHGKALDVFLHRNLATGAATIFRRALLQIALPIPKMWLHDEWLGVVAAALGGVDVETKPLIDYRQHSNNQVGAKRENWIQRFRGKLSPRGTAHKRRQMRAEELLTRLQALGALVPAQAVEAAADKVAHHRARAAFPRNRWARCVPILREVRTGRYARFGKGLSGITEDFLEAA